MKPPFTPPSLSLATITAAVLISGALHRYRVACMAGTNTVPIAASQLTAAQSRAAR